MIGMFKLLLYPTPYDSTLMDVSQRQVVSCSQQTSQSTEWSSHLVNHDTILWNNKGYIFFHSVLSFSLFLLITLTLLPSISITIKEQQILKDRRTIANHLHSELKTALNHNENKYPYNKSKKINDKLTNFSFTQSQSLIKVCADWINDRDKTESVCLYGKRS